MQSSGTIPYFNLLRNQIDITQVPFSDRGSRLLVFQHPGQSNLFIKLAERLLGLEPGLESYLRRPSYVSDLEFIDENGASLDFETVTSPDVIYFQTRIGEFGLTYQDNRTLAFGLPQNVVAGVRFLVLPDYWRNDEQGGELKSIRNLAFSSNAGVAKKKIKPYRGGYLVEFIVQAGEDSTITLHISPKLDLTHPVRPFSESCSAAEKRWQDWFGRAPRVPEPYRRKYAYAWWVMANNLISPLGNVMYEAMTPSKTSYVGLWLWDSAMHTLAFRHVDPELARNQIRAVLAYQLPDGMLPDAIYDEGVVSEVDHPVQAVVTKPPILAWSVLKLHETSPDEDFLKEVYVALVRWNAWWFSMNDDDVDGLAQYNHPYSSGLDNNPLWDQGMPVESPDLNTYLCVQMGSLAQMAEILNMPSEAVMWRKRAEGIVRRMIEDFWDAEAGIFRSLYHDQPIQVVTPFNLYPLWTGQLPDDIKMRLLEHLRNTDEFYGEYMLPTVSRSDPTYDPESMWRGPVWANINYFFIEALQQIREYDLARDLREKTLKMIMDQPGIFEYYNAETGQPPVKAANVFGWTAAVFIDLALQVSREAGFDVEDRLGQPGEQESKE
jgi:putative isomerase